MMIKAKDRLKFIDNGKFRIIAFALLLLPAFGKWIP